MCDICEWEADHDSQSPTISTGRTPMLTCMKLNHFKRPQVVVEFLNFSKSKMCTFLCWNVLHESHN